MTFFYFPSEEPPIEHVPSDLERMRVWSIAPFGLGTSRSLLPPGAKFAQEPKIRARARYLRQSQNSAAVETGRAARARYYSSQHNMSHYQFSS